MPIAAEIFERRSLGPHYDEGMKILEDLGLRIFTEKEMREIAEKFSEELQKGLDKKEKSSLAMIPTHVEPVNAEQLPVGKKVLSLSIGGTTLRAGIAEVKEDHTVRLPKDEKEEDIFLKVNLPKKKFENAEEFWDIVVNQLPQEMLVSIDALAIIWGYPGNVIHTDYGLDTISQEDFSKGIVIPGISGISESNKEGIPVGKQLKEAIERKVKKLKAEGKIAVDKETLHNVPVVVANDTAAVAIAVPDCRIGLVNGTGFNIAVSVTRQENGSDKQELYNMEASGFDKIIQNALDKKVDKADEKPGRYIAEKQISGLYIGHQFQELIETLSRHNLPIRIKNKKELEGIDLDPAIAGNKEGLNTFLETIDGLPIDDPMVEVLKTAAITIRNRSAQSLAAQLGATIDTLGDEFPADKTVKVAFDGSIIRLKPDYKEIVEMYARLICGRHVELVDAGKQGDLVGAGSAALARIKKD